ncbi:MAG: Fe-S cluster assembly protein SufD [Cycloclasticus sp.]|nr:Fe-S cluster assembly protein SufD [Cycloclasticus sp.]MBQ0790388.1 Fe-S cluster assembly protein SufD [Cycloclasticus sp.]
MSVTHLPNTHYAGLLATATTSKIEAEADWLTSLRERAAAEFNVAGFPSPRDEEWRYTNISAIEKSQFSLSEKTAEVDQALLDEALLEGCYHLVFVDGYYQPKHSSLAGLADAVTVLPLSEVFTGSKEQQDLFKSLLDSVIEEHAQGFINFNTALFSDGALVCISENTVVDKPIQLAFISSQDGALKLSNCRNLIYAMASSKATVFETYTGVADSCYLTNVVTEVVVEPNANLTHSRLQAESLKAYHIGGVYTRLENNAIFQQNNYTFGAVLSRAEIHANLSEASDCTLDGLYIGCDHQHMDNHTRVHHNQPHAVSNEFYKGVMDDKARGVFQGRIVVAEDAQKTDATMNNRNLLLSERAEIDTKPQLEIYADDVKCAHGVTVGQLDDTAIFYLRSRGADEQMAENMLTFAFANEMVERISFKPLRFKVLDELLKRFPQAGMKKEWL